MQPVHLIILVHGLYGNPANLSVVQSELEIAAIDAKPSIVVYALASFTGSRTWDGVDVNAHRAAQEIDREVKLLGYLGKDVVAFSVMSYSLGGLIARYLVGLLHSRSPSFFDRHRPASFSTAATPHLGILKYGSTTNSIVHTIGRQLFSRSGQQMYCLDKDIDGRCLLDIMADPDRIFLQALRLFPRIILVVNGCNDQTVPYPTAAISLTDPFENQERSGIEVDDGEDHVVRSWRMPGEDEVVMTGGRTKVVRKTPRIPPFILLRWPFTYLLVVLVPFLLPIALLCIAVTFVLFSFQSRRRTSLYHKLVEYRPQLSESTTNLLQEALPSRLTDLVAFPSKPSSRASAPTDGIETPVSSSVEAFQTRLTDLVPSPSTSSSRTTSQTEGTETPPLAPIRHPIFTNSRVPLLLTPQQKTMIANFNSIPQIERLIGWYPTAYNSHAVLIVRDLKRIPWVEEGRGVVRRWARWVVASELVQPDLLDKHDTIVI